MVKNEITEIQENEDGTNEVKESVTLADVDNIFSKFDEIYEKQRREEAYLSSLYTMSAICKHLVDVRTTGEMGAKQVFNQSIAMFQYMLDKYEKDVLKPESEESSENSSPDPLTNPEVSDTV